MAWSRERKSAPKSPVWLPTSEGRRTVGRDAGFAGVLRGLIRRCDLAFLRERAAELCFSRLHIPLSVDGTSGFRQRVLG